MVTTREQEFREEMRSRGMWLFFLMLTVLFNLFFSFWTSPYYSHWYACDSSLFAMVGRGILEGKVPYQDFYDLKGPYLFFINALGQMIHRGRLGTFIIQIPFALIMNVFAWKTARLYLSRAKAVFVMLIYFFSHVSTIWGGGTIEEYMMALNMVAVYLVVSFMKDHDLKTERIPTIRIFFTGLFFGVMLFAKVTNAAPVIGMCLGITVILIMHKRFTELFRCILIFLFGALVSSLPMIIFFASKGALTDMLYCVFVFGFMRSVGNGDPEMIIWEMQLLGTVFSFLVAVLHFPVRSGDKSVGEPERGNEKAGTRILRKLKSLYKGSDRPQLPVETAILLSCTAGVTYILLHIGSPWPYYFQTQEPVIILAFTLLLHMYDPLILFSNVREAVCLLVLFVFILYFAIPGKDNLKQFIFKKNYTAFENYYKDCKSIAEMIPSTDLDSVYSFGVHMAFYEITRIMPCNKYPDSLTLFITTKPSIEDEVIDFIDKTPPKWLVIGHEDFPDGGIMRRILEKVYGKYTQVYSNDNGSLYQLTEVEGVSGVSGDGSQGVH